MTGNELSRQFNELFGDVGPSGRIDADVLRGHAANEPPIYTVISFRIMHPGGGRTYDYAAIRASDGKWYPTGGETKQGVDWPTLVRAVRARLVGPITVLGPIRQVFV